MEVCSILLKKSNTEFTCKQTNATPQRKCIFWLNVRIRTNPPPPGQLPHGQLPPYKFPLDNSPPRQLTPGQLPPNGKVPPQTIAPRTITTLDNSPRQLPPANYPRTIAPGPLPPSNSKFLLLLLWDEVIVGFQHQTLGSLPRPSSTGTGLH